MTGHFTHLECTDRGATYDADRLKPTGPARDTVPYTRCDLAAIVREEYRALRRAPPGSGTRQPRSLA